MLFEEKVEDAITNLEVAVNQIKNFREKQPGNADDEILVYTISLIRESLEALRGIEVNREIDSLSGDVTD